MLKETEAFYTKLYHSNGINKDQVEENLKHLKGKLQMMKEKY